MKLTPEQEIEALEFFKMLGKAVKEIADSVGEQDITNVPIMDTRLSYKERRKLR